MNEPFEIQTFWMLSWILPFENQDLFCLDSFMYHKCSHMWEFDTTYTTKQTSANF